MWRNGESYFAYEHHVHSREHKVGVARVLGTMGGSPESRLRNYDRPYIIHRLHARFPRTKNPGSHAKRVFEHAINALTFRGYILFDTWDFSGDPLNLRNSFFAALMLNERMSPASINSRYNRHNFHSLLHYRPLGFGRSILLRNIWNYGTIDRLGLYWASRLLVLNCLTFRGGIHFLNLTTFPE